MNPYRYQLGYKQIRAHQNRVIRERNAAIHTLLITLSLVSLLVLAAIYIAAQGR